MKIILPHIFEPRSRPSPLFIDSIASISTYFSIQGEIFNPYPLMKYGSRLSVTSS